MHCNILKLIWLFSTSGACLICTSDATKKLIQNMQINLESFTTILIPLLILQKKCLWDIFKSFLRRNIILINKYRSDV